MKEISDSYFKKTQIFEKKEENKAKGPFPKKSFSEIFDEQQSPKNKFSLPSIFSIAKKKTGEKKKSTFLKKCKEKRKDPSASFFHSMSHSSKHQHFKLMQEKRKFENAEKISTMQNTTNIKNANAALGANAGEVSKLDCSNDVHLLFQNLVSQIAILTEKGISTTTLILSDNAGIFKGCEIVLEHFDTAPHSFNIELKGTPEAVALFEKNIADLEKALKNQFQNAQFSQIKATHKSPLPPVFKHKVDPLPLKTKEKSNPKKVTNTKYKK